MVETTTLAISFLAGLASFLSPCVFPLIPAFLTYLAGSSSKEISDNVPGIRMRIFLNSIFFVLGFTVVFSVLGVLLQGVLSTIAYSLRIWLGYIGGVIIIFFGLFLLGIIKVGFLQSEHKVSVKKTRFQFLSSFLFGGAFAVGWTPCVGAVLGAVLTLAVTNPASAFPLMVAYSLGLGLPFLVAGAFFSQATGIIQKISPWLKWFNLVFGILLIILGILVFTGSLGAVANLGYAVGLVPLG